MTVTSPGNPRDVQDFQFKLLCRLKVFTGQDGSFTSAVNLVAPASKYGLVCVGCPNGIQVIQSASILGLEHSGGSGGDISNYPRREVPLPSSPTHLSISCDQNYLVVAITKDGCAHGLIYSVPSFTTQSIALVSEVRLSSKPDTSVLELTWNPGIPNILAACLSDGSMASYEVKPTGLDISTLPPATKARCFCWSPKGKQLVVGSEDGTLTQYKPDLKAVKTLQAPNLGSGSVAVVNILWLSNYQFAAVYRDKINIEERPGLLIVNAPKTGGVSFVNYEDICYSAGDLRPPQFYLIHQATWNILMVASANSMEVGVLGLQEDQLSWEQWTQEDAARAELPLTADKQETFPVGFGLDTSTQHELPWGENQTIPPMPVLYILSHQGVLCLFYAVCLKPNAPVICSPPEKLPDESGLSLFTTESSLSPEGKVQPQELEMHSGKAVTFGDGGVGSSRVNLTPKFESVATSQAAGGGTSVPSLFGQAPGSISSPFGAGLSGTPAINFGSGVSNTAASTPGFGFASTTSSPLFGSSLATTAATSSVGAGLTSSTPSFGTGLMGTPPTGFGAPGGFGTALNKPVSTTATTSSVPTFSTSTSNPPTVNFGFGLGGQSSGLGGAPSNQPAAGFSASLSFTSGSTQSPKPSFSFSTTPATTTNTKTTTASGAVNFSFSMPGASSTPQQTPKTLSQQPSLLSQSQPAGGSKPQVSFFGSATPTLQVTEQNKVQPSAQQPRTEVKQNQPSGSEPAPPATKPAAIPTLNSKVFFNAINEEITHFEWELKELQSRVAGTKTEVGTEDEKRTLCQKVASMEEFWRELKETTQAQSSEIHTLKSELMESFAWTEDAKSRIQQLNSPMYVQLTRSQSLDPVTARYASNIKHLVYYVENQLRQVNEQLDCKWLEFEESCKPSVKNKMHIPTLEAIYQAMVLQNNILNKQRAIMADIARRAQEQGKSTRIPLISTAVLSRVRDKESMHNKGETEVSRLAENLVQLKLGGLNGVPMNHRCRSLSRKKENYLRDVLSQRTVTRICPTKPFSPTEGGISTGKPIFSKMDKEVENKETSKLISGKVITEPAFSPAAKKAESAQALFMISKNKMSNDTANKFLGGLGGQSFSVVSGKSLGKEITGIATSSSLPVSETNKYSSSGNILGSKLGININDSQSINTASGQFTFTGLVQSGKTEIPENLSFTQGLNKDQPVTKVSDTSKKLEDYYEEITPPGTPAKSYKEPVPSPSSSTSSSSFSFNFTPSIKSNIIPPNSGGSIDVFQNSPLMSLDSIVAGIGDGMSMAKPANKPAETKRGSAVSLGSTTGSGSFTFSTMTLGQTQQRGGVIGKTEEPKKSADTFKFSLTSSVSVAPAVTSTPFNSGSSSLATPLKVPVITTTTTTAAVGTGLKTSFFSSFGNENRQPATTSLQGSMFGGGQTQKPAFSFSSGGSSGAAVSSASIFGQSAATVFGGISTGSPAKQPSSGSILGATSTPSTPSLFGKQGTVTPKQSADSTSPTRVGDTPPNESTPQKSESPEKVKTPPVTSTDNTEFSESTSLFGNLSMGLPAGPSTKPAASIFGGNSAGFSFGQPAPFAANQAAKAEAASTEISQSQTQQSESPTKDAQSPTISQSPTSSQSPTTSHSPITSQSPTSFGQPTATEADSKAQIVEATSSQPILGTTSIFGGGKVEGTAGATFNFGQASGSAAPVSTTEKSFFGEASGTAKSFSGSMFGAAMTSAVTSAVATSTATASVPAPTTAPSSTTFTFSLPASNQSSTPFGQATNLFGQPPSSTATTTSSSTFFGQPICSPSFGQSGSNIFGQAAAAATATATATATAKPSIFDQATVTTTSPSVFGQTPTTTSTQPIFGQSPATTSTQSIFGQSPATTSTQSIFGQTPATTTTQPIFGQTPTTSSTQSIFGQPPATTSTPSLFGQGTPSTSQSVFGQNPTSVFGQTPASSSSFLGGGSVGGFGSKPTFGQSGGSVFGGQSGSPGFGSSGGSVFGAGGGSFGGGTGSSGNLFQSSSGTSIFGGSTSPTGGSAAGGAFSSGMGQSISQSGFGSPPSFQSKPGGFGGSPVFGGSATGTGGFGAPPTFGGAPSFGGSPTFGSPGKVFGSTSPAANVSFGNTGQQQSSTFENLATQNTMTFGNLAQNQGQGFGSPTQPVFGATPQTQAPSTPSFTGGSTFGGSSFSSWR